MNYAASWDVKFVENSSNVVFYGFSSIADDFCDIVVGFKKGAIYVYRGCPGEHARGLDAAPSKGAYVASHLRVHPSEFVERIS